MAQLDKVADVLVTPVAVGVGLIGLTAAQFLPLSPFRRAALQVGFKPNDGQRHVSLAKAAVAIHDYDLAKAEWEQQKILGASTESQEGEIFPEQKIRREIARWEEISQAVTARDGLLRLVLLNWQVFDEAKAKIAFEQAKILDPNNERVKTVEKLLGF